MKHETEYELRVQETLHELFILLLYDAEPDPDFLLESELRYVVSKLTGILNKKLEDGDEQE